MSKQMSTFAIVRMSVLGLILVVVAGLMAYDKLLAKPSHEKAYTDLLKMSEEVKAKGFDQGMLNTEVHQKLGKTPSKTDTRGTRFVEYFHWMRGNLYASYEVSVVYRIKNGADGKPTYLLDEVYDGHHELPEIVAEPGSGAPRQTDPSGVGMGGGGGAPRPRPAGAPGGNGGGSGGAASSISVDPPTEDADKKRPDAETEKESAPKTEGEEKK